MLIEENLPSFLSAKELKFIRNYYDYKKNNTLKPLDSDFHINLENRVKNITQNEVNTLREKVMERIEKEKSNRNFQQRFIDELTLDVYLRRYIAKESKDTVDVVVKAIELLSDLSYINENEYPKEMLELGINASCGFDLYGNPVLYFFVKRYYPVKKFVESVESYTTFLLFQLVRISIFTNGSFTMLIDFSGASISNVDFNGLRILINILNDYAPNVFNRIICYNLHWLLKPAFKIGISILPGFVSNLLYITSPKDVKNFISLNQLTSIIEGGLNDEIIIGRPQKSGVSYIDIAEKLKLTKEEAEKILEAIKKYFKKNKIEYLAYE